MIQRDSWISSTTVYKKIQVNKWRLEENENATTKNKSNIA